MRVAFGRRMNAGQVNSVGHGERCIENTGAADDHDLVAAARSRENPPQRQRIDYAFACRDAVDLERGIAGDDNVVATVERLADRLKRAPAHDDGLAHRQPPEGLEVRRQPPRQAAVASDDAVFRYGNDK